MADTIGFGVVGGGAIGPTHCRAINGADGARLLAVCDSDPARAARLGQKFDVPSYTDLDAFLAHDRLEAVSLCVPSGLHASLGVKVAQAGKHLLVEKPIEVSLTAADELIEACEKAGVKLGVISQHRFAPDVQRLRQAIRAGELGPMVLGQAVIKWYRSQAYYDSGEWRGTYALDGGGALMNQGIHYIDLLLWLMGSPVAAVKGASVTRTHQIEVEDLAVATLEFADGSLGTITGSTSIYPGLPERLELHGQDGTAILEADRLIAYYTRRELGDVGNYGLNPAQLAQRVAELPQNEGERPDGPGSIGTDAHTAQIADFVAALRQDRPPAVTGHDARRPLELILAIYQSAREGREVRL